MTARYGILSDTHRNPQVVPALIAKLQQGNIDAIILNGDVGESPDHVAFTLNAAARTGLPVYVQPGSHEEIAAYVPVVDALSSRYSNIIDCVKHPKHIVNGQHLVFLPGSDWNAGGQYNLHAGEVPTGNYLRVREGLTPLNVEELAAHMRHPEAQKALLSITNMGDLDKLVDDAEHTVVFCHVPARCVGVDTGVDVAYFAEKADKSLLPGVVLEEMIRQQCGAVSASDMRIIAAQNGFTFKHENRGNSDLGAAYGRTGITKVISGHFHESAHRAHDSTSRHVEPGKFTHNLAYMASYADAGLAGIVVLKDNKIAYEPISLR